jgi:DNA mismatch repair ATPase MutS
MTDNQKQNNQSPLADFSDSEKVYNKRQLELAGILRRLFRQRYFLKSRNEKWFQILIDHLPEMQKSLLPFLIRLEINESNGLAFLTTLSSETEEKLDFAIGRKRNLSAFSSLMLLFLRRFRFEFFQNPNNLDTPLVQLAAIREFLDSFQKFKTDRGFEVTFRKSLEELQDLQVLIEVNAEEAIFEITAVCDVLLSSEDLEMYSRKIEAYFQSTESLPVPAEELC